MLTRFEKRGPPGGENNAFFFGSRAYTFGRKVSSNESTELGVLVLMAWTLRDETRRTVTLIPNDDESAVSGFPEQPPGNNRHEGPPRQPPPPTSSEACSAADPHPSQPPRPAELSVEAFPASPRDGRGDGGGGAAISSPTDAGTSA